MTMKKEKQEIAVNTSSGAEKVENVEKEIKKAKGVTTKTTTVKTQSAKGDSAMGDSVKSREEKMNAKKMNANSTNGKAEKESKAAKARVEAALKKKEMQEKRKAEREALLAKKKAEKAKKAAEKKALIEKRAAEKKALIEKRAAEKKALAEKRAAEKENRVRERAHAKANRKQAQSKKKSERKKTRNNSRERKEGYGGWLAAVITLGVVTLALTTTVTVGALDMMSTKKSMMAGYRGTMYELTGIMEHVDDDLDRVRVSASPAQQSRILTDLLVQARMAEADLEKLPVEAEADRNVTVFLNRTAMECERMLSKLRNGGELSDSDFETLENLYKTNHYIRTELDKLSEEMTDDDLMCYMKKGEGSVAEILKNLENATLEENRAAFEKHREEKEGAGMQRNASSPSNEDGERIDAARAEELCLSYFKDYAIQQFQCIGETVSRSYTAYNVQGYDDKGTLLFAELDQKSGALLRFDYYEDCEGETFDIENAERIAEEFLQMLGYEDMEVVRLRENGTTTDFTFVYEDDGVVYYPDEIRVKVCRTRGQVTGLDTTKYIRNHHDREEPSVKISLAEAYGKLHKKLTVEASRLAVVRTARGERVAYEFFCSYGEEQYFVYLDAETGKEISIVNAKQIA